MRTRYKDPGDNDANALDKVPGDNDANALDKVPGDTLVWLTGCGWLWFEKSF